MAAHSGPVCLPPSPRRILYGQRKLADPFQPSTLYFHGKRRSVHINQLPHSMHILIPILFSALQMI